MILDTTKGQPWGSISGLLQSWTSFWIPGGLAYLFVVRFLRFQRRDSLSQKFGYTTRASFARMTLQDAHAMQLALSELEFPRIFSASVFFTLFKTYGIPSISSLLVATGQLAKETTASQRAADTGVIITEVVLNKPESPRTIDGITRMNFLHNRYRKAGKISDEDMLYTLSLFALEPIRWTNRYEWRTLTDTERCAMGVYWKDLGESMVIPFSLLRSSKTGWNDALHWLDELEEWSLEYQAENMVPANSNAMLAAATLDLAVFNLPTRLRATGKKFGAALLEPQLQKAMMLAKPPPIYTTILNFVMKIRKFFLRHFFLPRPRFMIKRWFTSTPDPLTGRFNALQYIAHPWYIKPTLSARWGAKAWLLWLTGGVLPSNDENGADYHPEGYHIRELGPATLRGKGESEMDEDRARLVTRRRGCAISAK